jgi:hypothetical protein
MKQPKQKKTKFITIRVSDYDIQTLEAIRYHYEREGIKLNLSGVFRDTFLKLPV